MHQITTSWQLQWLEPHVNQICGTICVGLRIYLIMLLSPVCWFVIRIVSLCLTIFTWICWNTRIDIMRHISFVIVYGLAPSRQVSLFVLHMYKYWYEYMYKSSVRNYLIRHVAEKSWIKVPPGWSIFCLSWNMPVKRLKFKINNIYSRRAKMPNHELGRRGLPYL